MKLLLIFLGTVFAFAGNSMKKGPNVYAGRAAYGGVLCPLPGQSPPVRLERQAFWIDTDTNHIQTEYVLHNTGASRQVTICVPEYREQGNPLGLEDLRVWTDGHLAHPSRRELATKPSDFDFPVASAPNALWTIRLSLHRGQQRRVRVSYVSWGRGHESLLWLLYFPNTRWQGSVPQTDLTVYSKDFGTAEGEWPEVRLFSRGFSQNWKDIKIISVSHKGHRLVHRWRNWKPSGFLMVVQDN